MNFLVIGAIPLMATVSFMVSKPAMSADPVTVVHQSQASLGIIDETDGYAPVDYGPGPGYGPAVKRQAQAAPAAFASSSQIPVGGTTAKVTGVFDPAVPWPIIPLHAVLLPDGRVMSCGTDQHNRQRHFLQCAVGHGVRSRIDLRRRSYR